MEHFLNNDKNHIHLSFEKPLIGHLKELQLKIDPCIEFINKSYVNYYDEKTIHNKKYMFRGFYKDGYFIIIIDVIDLELNNIIFDKNVIVSKLKWNFIKHNDIHIWEINTQKNQKYDYFSLPIRHFLEHNYDLSIDDILNIHDKNPYQLCINKSSFKDLLKGLYFF